MIEKLIGVRNASIAKTWAPNMATWGAASLVSVIYFTDWKLILQYVPYIGGKYKEDDE
ncbi:cytochrome b-c1 complex subunit 10 [Austrofundulus limnaeus]|uniref:Cytochrome b-c1 complex subunit 10 n=1 Tax=Austrofundulus limnaeus TaxID=52670 RepID=A0A2I4C959_AUSLI|nr:PREDICTED: cytochrome b-c1 complex subunit 10 [Austrofundulus limnaeus]XP_013876525.1 PREDICTED: cytochrome b-c1 complex subunit 10 [Austrofundulus limnaeus]XP_013876533.1 PREDICTED: cytochrome b-c1 complex subunit 10 [Austrofundulus limnaeus]